MSRARKVLVPIITVLLIAAVVVRSWSSRGAAIQESTAPQTTAPLEEQIFTVQARIMVGSILWTEENRSKVPPDMSQEIREKIRNGFRESLASDAKGETDSASLIQKRLVLAKFLELDDEANRLWTQLVSHPEKNDRTARVTSILGAIFGLPGSDTPLTREDLEFVETHLQWFGTFVRATGTSDPEEKAALTERFAAPARSAVEKLGTGIVVLIGFALLSISLFCWFLFQSRKGKIQFEFQPPSIDPQYCLEIFALYLATMLAGSTLLEKAIGAGAISNPLAANIVMIGALPILLLWGCMGGYSLKQIAGSIGLQTGGAGRAIDNLLLAPFLYIGSWTVLFIILFIYSMTVYALGIDLSQGAHPIVPTLLSADPRQIVLVIILASVIAPIVEEIFFRGALYGWLRTWASRWPAVLISGIIFAIVHPQGALGVVPLAAIGCVLAFAREWKQSLVLSMGVHACVNSVTLAILLLFFR